MKKDINIVECSGRLTYKRYNPDSKQLFLVVYVAVPRASVKNSKSSTDVMRDRPAFVYQGDDAEEIDARLAVNDRVTVIGHADTEQVFEPQGRGLFREAYRTSLIADSVMACRGMAYSNVAILGGEISRVYRNDGDGKRFYIITLKIRLDDGTETRTSFTYFDSGMHLEPKNGEYIQAVGTVQVKREDVPGTGRSRYLTTIVGRSVGTDRKDSPAEHSSGRAANGGSANGGSVNGSSANGVITRTVNLENRVQGGRRKPDATKVRSVEAEPVIPECTVPVAEPVDVEDDEEEGWSDI